MSSSPNSDEIIVAVLDDGEEIAVSVWNGDTFTNTMNIETRVPTSSRECMCVAYESVSGNAIVVWSEFKGDSAHYRIWNGESWSAEADTPTLGSTPAWVRLASDPTSDRILLGTLTGADDVNVTFWDGASWEPWFEVETGTGNSVRRCFDVAYESSGNEAMVAWWDNGVETLDYRVWTPSGGWSPELIGPDLGGQIWIVQLMPDPDSDAMILSTKVHTAALQEDLRVTRWRGSSWDLPAIIEPTSSGASTESFMAAY